LPISVDTVSLRRENGGTATRAARPFEMGREAWQGEPVDRAVIDEDPEDFEITANVRPA